MYTTCQNFTTDALHPLACRRTAMHCPATNPVTTVQPTAVVVQPTAAAVQSTAAAASCADIPPTYMACADADNGMAHLVTFIHGLCGVLTWMQPDTLPLEAYAYVCRLMHANMHDSLLMRACLFVPLPLLVCCTHQQYGEFVAWQRPSAMIGGWRLHNDAEAGT
jgi:hypothetical protein